MDFDHATRFVRIRAGETTDAYNPKQRSRDWSTPDKFEIHGSLSSSSSRRSPNGLREETTSNAYLTVTDPDCDVRLGDRIRPQPDDGRLWTVTGMPSHDMNPFTGWRPTLEIQLTEWKG